MLGLGLAVAVGLSGMVGCNEDVNSDKGTVKRDVKLDEQTLDGNPELTRTDNLNRSYNLMMKINPNQPHEYYLSVGDKDVAAKCYHPKFTDGVGLDYRVGNTEVFVRTNGEVLIFNSLGSNVGYDERVKQRAIKFGDEVLREMIRMQEYILSTNKSTVYFDLGLSPDEDNQGEKK